MDEKRISYKVGLQQAGSFTWSQPFVTFPPAFITLHPKRRPNPLPEPERSLPPSSLSNTPHSPEIQFSVQSQKHLIMSDQRTNHFCFRPSIDGIMSVREFLKGGFVEDGDLRGIVLFDGLVGEKRAM